MKSKRSKKSAGSKRPDDELSQSVLVAGNMNLSPRISESSKRHSMQVIEGKSPTYNTSGGMSKKRPGLLNTSDNSGLLAIDKTMNSNDMTMNMSLEQ